MADLLKSTAQKSTGTSRHAKEIERKRAAHKAFNDAFAALAHNKPAPSSGPVHLLSGALPSFPPAPQTTQKADPLANASERVKRLSLCHGPEAGKLLDLIERRSKEEKGAAINFTTADAARAMGTTHEHAERILGALLQAGTLTPRSGPFGNREGYVLTGS